ncbi:F-box domain protein [Aspergillus bombycis]|uniref:F-box domain protein n=1 Tax=Aspergillus bombycis TaxID=109264 RepID=A0A1F7ZQH0_9EURO|nr:F-box domain protein [Aspergillus bombycis]OGM41706.1 F-box domain protein [Aspergillus bombycis]
MQLLQLLHITRLKRIANPLLRPDVSRLVLSKRAPTYRLQDQKKGLTLTFFSPLSRRTFSSYFRKMATDKPTSPKAKPFTQLPTDCLISILDQLSSKDSLAVSTTCKDVRASATPFAYRDVTLDWSNRPLRRLLQLLRLIFNDPDIASYIHHVSLVSSEPGTWEETPPALDWETECHNFRDVINQSIDIIQRAGFSDLDDWHAVLKSGNTYCYAAILLSQLPNLKSLRLDYSFVWQDGYPGTMLKQALFSPNGVLSTFQHLEIVDYGGNVPIAEHEDESRDGYPACNPDQFMAWFYLPSLRHLSIWLRDISELQDNVPKLHLNNLETLILARTTISESDVSFLLSQTPNLRTLHLGLAYAWGRELVLQNADTLANALKPLHETLHHLSLGVEYYPSTLGDRYWDGADDHFHEPLGGMLSWFPNLVSAEVPLCVIMGWYIQDATDLGPRLPRSLQRLCLREDLRSFYDFEWEQDEVDGLIRGFVSSWRGFSPQLECITWRLWDQNYMDGWEEFQGELREACAEKGLGLEVVVDELGTGLWSREEFSLARGVS